LFIVSKAVALLHGPFREWRNKSAAKTVRGTGRFADAQRAAG
jgi:hypothetical protein